ncbi:TPA: hypothetical protein ACH3X2_012135 [Trebouxia sp. C0005]
MAGSSCKSCHLISNHKCCTLSFNHKIYTHSNSCRFAPRLHKHKLRPQLQQWVLFAQLQQAMLHHPQPHQQHTPPVINCMFLRQLSSIHLKGKPSVSQAETLIESLGCQAGSCYSSTSNS